MVGGKGDLLAGLLFKRELIKLPYGLVIGFPSNVGCDGMRDMHRFDSS
jgi:hypothetical protein